MFARRKQNKNGTTSVQVIDKSHKSYRVVKSFGVGHSEAEIYRLEEKARQYILERQGLANGLFEDEDEMKLETFLSSLSNSQLQVIGPELIFGTLYDIPVELYAPATIGMHFQAKDGKTAGTHLILHQRLLLNSWILMNI